VVRDEVNEDGDGPGGQARGRQKDERSMAKDSTLRCRPCGRTPTETGDAVSTGAEAFTCSRCLLGVGRPRVAPSPPAIEEQDSRQAEQLLRRAISPKGFEVTLVREPTPQSRRHHYGIYRRGLRQDAVLAGRNTSGPGRGRWTPHLQRAEAIFELFLQDVTDPVALAQAGRAEARLSDPEPA
jgi:hypothetical protein